MNDLLGRPKKRCLYEDIAGSILGLIAGGVYLVGDRLPGEREMAERLGVNRGTLREALRVLELMRVIEKRVGDGIYVISGASDFGLEAVLFRFMAEDGLDADSLTNAFEAVIRIEGVIAELAAERMETGNLAGLKTLHGAMVQAVGSGENFAAMDREFHQSVGKSSQSPVLLGVACTMGNHRALCLVAVRAGGEPPQIRGRPRQADRQFRAAPAPVGQAYHRGPFLLGETAAVGDGRGVIATGIKGVKEWTTGF